MPILILPSQMTGRVKKMRATGGGDGSKSGFSTASLNVDVESKSVQRPGRQSTAFYLKLAALFLVRVSFAASGLIFALITECFSASISIAALMVTALGA